MTSVIVEVLVVLVLRARDAQKESRIQSLWVRERECRQEVLESERSRQKEHEHLLVESPYCLARAVQERVRAEPRRAKKLRKVKRCEKV